MTLEPSCVIIAPLPRKGEIMEGVATDKQVDFILKLASERNVHYSEGYLRCIDKVRASEIISTLLAQPKATALAKKPVALVEGIYYKEGVVYKVQISEAGRAYAKVLRDAGFVYDPTAVKNLSPEDKITIEQAKAYGIKYGVCCVCGRTLTDSTSVAEGIGPVCGKRI